jgi:hypothetical protein
LRWSDEAAPERHRVADRVAVKTAMVVEASDVADALAIAWDAFTAAAVVQLDRP